MMQEKLHYCFLDTILRTICHLPAHKQEEYQRFPHFSRFSEVFINIHECANEITVIYVHDTRKYAKCYQWWKSTMPNNNGLDFLYIFTGFNEFSLMLNAFILHDYAN